MNKKLYVLAAITSAIVVFSAVLFSCNPLSGTDVLQGSDTIAPVITITSPADGDPYSATVTVTGRVSDDADDAGTAGRVNSVTWEVTGTALGGTVDVESDGSFSFEFSTNGVAGTITLKVTAVDWNGNEAEITIQLTTPKEFTSFVFEAEKNDELDTDAVGSIGGATVYVTVPEEVNLRSLVPTFEIVGLSVTVNEVPQVSGQTANDFTEPVEYVITGSDLSQKTYTVTVAGNNDTTAPVISIVSPEDNTPYTARVVVTGTITDTTDEPGEPGGIVESVWQAVDADTQLSGDVSLGTDGSFSFFFDTDELSGTSTVTLSATDWNSNTATASFILVDGPQIPSFTVESFDHDSVTLSWDDVVLSGGYTIFYTVNPAEGDPDPGEGDASESPDPGTTTYTFDNLDRGSRYCFRLRSNSTEGGDNWSEAVTALPVSSRTLLPRTMDEPGKVYLSWREAIGAYSYDVLRSDAKDGVYSVIGTVTDTQYEDTDTEYRGSGAWYKVQVNGIPDSVSDPAWGESSVFSRWREIGSFDTAHIFSAAVQGSYAYCTYDDNSVSRVLILDISDPSQPFQVGTIEGIPGRGILADENYLYICDTSGLVHIYSLSTPSNPAFVSSVSVIGTSSSTWAVAKSGSYLYVGTENSFETINISDIFNPFVEDWVGMSRARNLAVSGNYVYVAASSDGIHVVDVTDPTNISIEATVPAVGTLFDVAIHGNYLYAADTANFERYIQVIDITTPTSPTIELSHPSVVDDLYSVYIDTDGRYLYAAGQADSAGSSDPAVEIIDIRYPDQASSVTSLEETVVNGVFDMTIADDTLICCSLTGDITFLDTATPDGAVHVTDIGLGGETAMDVVVSGSYAYVATTESMKVLELDTPSSPYEVASLPASGDGSAIQVSGNLAFLANSTGGMDVFNISRPEEPQFLKTLATSDGIYGIVSAGDYVYVTPTLGLGTFAVFDTSDVDAAVETAVTGTAFLDGIMKQETVYAVSGEYITSLDASVYDYPAELDYEKANNGVPSLPVAIDVSGNTACVVDDFRAKVSFFDVSDTLNLLQGSILDCTQPMALSFTGPDVLVRGSGKLCVFDAFTYDNAFSTLTLNDLDTGDGGIAVSGRYAYVADGASGIAVFDLLPGE